MYTCPFSVIVQQKPSYRRCVCLRFDTVDGDCSAIFYTYGVGRTLSQILFVYIATGSRRYHVVCWPNEKNIIKRPNEHTEKTLYLHNLKPTTTTNNIITGKEKADYVILVIFLPKLFILLLYNSLSPHVHTLI